MAQPVIHTSFAAGELSPNLYARVDLDKYHVGAALMRNFFADYRGGASTRMGTQHIAGCLSTGTPRLIPFQFSTTQTYVLEFGNLYLRIYSNGLAISGADFQLVTPYAESDLPLLKFAQSADTMTLTHPSYPPYLLTRTGATAFNLAAMVIAPTQLPPDTLTVDTNASGHAQFSAYCVTAISADGVEESLASNIVYLGHSASGSNATLAWHAPAGVPPSQYFIYKWGPIAESTSGSARCAQNSAFGFVGYSNTVQFDDQGVAPDYTRQPPQFQDPFKPNQPTGITVTSQGGSYGATSPPTVTMSGGTPSGKAHAVLNDGGGVGGVIVDFPGMGTQTVSFSPTTGGPAASVTGYSASSGTYPGCCTYFQQRQCFAASNNDPQKLWMSQTGNVFNFDTSPVAKDSDAINISLASRQVNVIASLVPMPSGMIVLTSGGAWLLSGGGQSLAVTPISIAAQPQASSGANDVPPIVINNDVLYVQSRGSIVRDLVYNYYVQSYFGTDRSALANHLFFGYQILQWAYAEEPFRIIWAVRNDGIALALTYVPEQEVYAWSHHDTNGQFISVCSVVEGQQDAVYFIVKRFINGAWVNYIERLASRNFYNNAEFPFCLDCGKDVSVGEAYLNANLTLSGVSGRVDIYADAGVFSFLTVNQCLRGLYGGKANVIAYIDDRHVIANVQQDGLGNDFFPIVPNSVNENNPNGTPQLLQSGNWFVTTPSTTFTGMSQLAGETISVLGDGLVYKNVVVNSSGGFTLPQKASLVFAGLPFTAQLQTLYLDTGDPTIQSKRKLLPALTARVDNTKGLKVGPTFNENDLVEYKTPALAGNYTPPGALSTEDLFTNLFWDWNTYGQVCVQQDYPLPASVLGLIPQVIIGDTGR